MFRCGIRGLDRRWNPGAGVFLCALFALFAQPPAHAQEAPRWTLDEALSQAFTNSPVLQAQRAVIDENEGALLGARIYPYNPVLALEVADRRGSDRSTTDRALSLSQELEIAGQRRKRVAVAQQELAAAQEAFLRQQRQLAFRVKSAFAEAVRNRELLRIAETDAELAREVLSFSQRRLERGVATQIEVNLAQAGAGRAERALQRARASYAAARALLAELAGSPPSTLPEPMAELVLPREDLPPAAVLLARAKEHRGDLRALQFQEQAAQAGIRLARAEGRPNLIAGGFTQREEGSDDIVGASLTLALPLFNRNQGRIAGSRATHDRLRSQAEALRLSVEQEVVAALSELQAARAAAAYLEEQVIGTLEENVELLQRSFSAGRVSATEVVTLRRELVAGQREYVEALADAWLARARLDLATGRGPGPESFTAKEMP